MKHVRRLLASEHRGGLNNVLPDERIRDLLVGEFGVREDEFDGVLVCLDVRSIVSEGQELRKDVRVIRGLGGFGHFVLDVRLDDVLEGR